MRNIFLVMKLPWELCRYLDPDDWDATQLTRGCKKIVSRWSSIGAKLASIPSLSAVEMWIDHESTRRWAEVHERAITLPLTSLASSFSLTIHLPWLHPWFEDPNRHFLDGTTSPSTFKINRFIRQRKFFERDENQKPWIVTADDFPFLAKQSDDWDFELEQLIAEERSLWNQGIDVYAGLAEWEKEEEYALGLNIEWYIPSNYVSRRNCRPPKPLESGREKWREFLHGYDLSYLRLKREGRIWERK